MKTTTTSTPRTDPLAGHETPALGPGMVEAHVPDLSAAARAILSGACLSIGPTGGLATRAPQHVRGDAARAFIDEKRQTLRPVLDDAQARAALLQLLRPWPLSWGGPGGCGLVAVLWTPDVARLETGLLLAQGHRVVNVERFISALRREALEGPTRVDCSGERRFTARLRTGGFVADITALDAALARLS